MGVHHIASNIGALIGKPVADVTYFQLGHLTKELSVATVPLVLCDDVVRLGGSIDASDAANVALQLAHKGSAASMLGDDMQRYAGRLSGFNLDSTTYRDSIISLQVRPEARGVVEALAGTQAIHYPR